MRQMFVNKVKETEAELKEKEKVVRTVQTLEPPRWFETFLVYFHRVFCHPCRQCLASREVWAAQACAPRRKEKSWGEKTRAGGRDERFQQKKGGCWNSDGTGTARMFTAATQEGQRQEKVSCFCFYLKVLITNYESNKAYSELQMTV